MKAHLDSTSPRAAMSAVLLAAALFQITACGAARRPSGEPLLTTRAGEISWDLWLSPDPPRQKGNVLWLQIRGAQGHPVVGAELGSGYLMPAMGAMAEMRGQGDVTEQGEGLYRVAFDFPMQGTWSVHVTVDTGSGRALAEYSLTTGTPGLRELTSSGPGATAEVGPGEVEARAGAPPARLDELPSGVVRIDAQRRQEIGVRTAVVELRPVTVTIRAVATVTYDETRLTEVSLKNRGWIERLFVNETGQAVRRGQTLFTLYSPELLAAQEELLAALASQDRARQTEVPGRADYLVDAARRRLLLWDLSSEQVEEIVRTREPIQNLAILSPASGHVVEKGVIEGGAVSPGQTLYRIADLATLWLEAAVYESELPLVKVGQEAEVTFPYLPGRKLRARVGYVYPYLEPDSRTGTVRLELANPGLELKPNMYADVVLEAPRGERVVVPEEAVIYAGKRRMVFLDLGDGRLQPRTVELGVKSGDGHEVLSGLEVGEVVVTSGNFLIAAESRLKSAAEKW